MTVKWLIVQTNSEGRPCGWGLSTDKRAAKDEAQRQFDGHRCYPGEKRGEVLMHLIEAED